MRRRVRKRRIKIDVVLLHCCFYGFHLIKTLGLEIILPTKIAMCVSLLTFWILVLCHCYCAICTLIVEEVKGEKIGVMGDYPITVTSIGCLFLFRVVGPRETSPVTWGLEKAKSKWLDKDPLSQVTIDHKVWFYNQ
jgi:hypothetical protein